MQALLAITMLSIIAEAVVEYVTAPLGKAVPGWAKAYAGLAVGIGLCVAYQSDLPSLLGLVTLYPVVGQVLTGILIGRGSNVFSGLVKQLNVVRLPAAPLSDVADSGLVAKDGATNG